AVFHTAAVWRWSSHLQTGNYVPKGETAPGRMAESKIQSVPNNLCQIEYVINTEHDTSIFFHQKRLEELFASNTSFNKANKPRRNWQLGVAPYDRRFTFTCQVFQRVSRTAKSDLEKISEYREDTCDLHPWIAKAVESPEWAPNRDCPDMYDFMSRAMQPLAEAEPRYFRKDDLVWISFRVRAIIGPDSWRPAFIPVEMVRVAVIPPALM
ncbi:hypothetical protein C8Q76DRAFT_599846, partial [Earliella scabrosa]